MPSRSASRLTKSKSRLAVLRAMFEARIARRALVLEVDVIVRQHLADDRRAPSSRWKKRQCDARVSSHRRGRTVARYSAGRFGCVLAGRASSNAVTMPLNSRSPPAGSSRATARSRCRASSRCRDPSARRAVRDPIARGGPVPRGRACGSSTSAFVPSAQVTLRDAVGVGEHHRWSRRSGNLRLARGGIDDRRPRRPRCTGRWTRCRATADCRAAR